jgi:hypothetical protein
MFLLFFELSDILLGLLQFLLRVGELISQPSVLLTQTTNLSPELLLLGLDIL